MPLLELESVEVFYGDLQAVFGVSLSLAQGEALALIGANGAGKSTLLNAITGLVPARAGVVRFDGESIAGLPAEKIAALGIAMVPEGRLLFPSLSVEENLLMGTLTRRAGPWNLDAVYSLFSMLHEMRNRPATRLSGGQQQMVAIGRALMSNPRLLLCDELSLGLAPLVIEEIYRAFERIRAEGLSVILVEQDVARACKVSEQLLCLLKGRVTLAGPVSQFSHSRIAAAYFGE
ncbi:ABC transporter ATP-binding protein [Ramlibacter sp. WS9]|uniref:ABC transporter ATP-binding protein n=1 Tax=Ramlibacter sp. WS9 TaxID=1882741 RepID=UPI00114400AE|nr:ABC transporter ATP-binding protein [Ramlibacter sp. WS9]ROZ78096.1 ABC transporter ATP-binding protein [Ramlibacter sp. WS9]HSV36684.1 ABC transporter ATP-binding protein [Ramlibacter sp.]